MAFRRNKYDFIIKAYAAGGKMIEIPEAFVFPNNWK